MMKHRFHLLEIRDSLTIDNAREERALLAEEHG
jgi:hypothetical protein